MKDKLCENCPGYKWPGPVMGEFTGDQVNVIFVGEALGYWEVQKNRPMIGPAGKVLRTTLQQTGLDASCGITNVWKCKPPGNKLPENVESGEFCKQSLIEDLTTYGQGVTVTLGGTALNALVGDDLSVTSAQRRLFSVPLNGSQIPILAMLHPSYISRRGGGVWRDWELGFDKLDRYLKGHIDFIAEKDRITHHVTDYEEAAKWLERLVVLSKTHEKMTCDIETSAGYTPWAGARILCVSISWSFTESVTFKWECIKDTDLFGSFKALLESTAVKWGWYVGQFDTQFFRDVGIIPRIDFDASLEAHMVDERLNIHSLKRDAGVFLDASDWERDVKLYAPKKTDSFELIPEDKLYRYCGLDTIHTLQLSQVLQRHMEEEGTVSYCETVTVPMYNVLSLARFTGIRVDLYRIRELQSQIQPVLDELQDRMIKLTGNVFFNPRSSQDKLRALEERGIDVVNTRKETLEVFEGDELVDDIREYMDAAKMMSTYLVGVAQNVYEDLRIHPDWRTPTETGRPRCSEPNVLGMPRKAEEYEHRWKRYIKEIFIADPGTRFMHIDRKQSEVRCEVFLADDVAFIEHLRNHPKADIHGEFTALIYGAGYTAEQRVIIKMVVFGIIYNRQAASLAVQFTAIERQKARREGREEYRKWTKREAQKFIDDFFVQMPGVYEHRRVIIKEALSTGTLTNYLGRIRRFGLVNDYNRHSITNEAVNFPPSSLSADINHLSCIETTKRFGKYGVVVLAPIHDSGLLRIPEDSLYLEAEIEGMWVELATNILQTKLPFPCDVSIGERWSDL